MGLKSYNIDNIFSRRVRLKDYPRLPLDVREVIDYTIKENLKANPLLRTMGMLKSVDLKPKQDDFWMWPWEDLIMLREAASEGKMLEVFEIVYGLTEKQVVGLEAFNAFAAYKWIIDQLKQIAETEKNEFEEPSQEMKAAGIDILTDLGYTVAVDELAKGQLWMHKELLKKPYAIIFRQLVLIHRKEKIKKQHTENVSRKNKRNS